MPPKTLLRLGLGFAFLALVFYFSSGHWLKTRIFTPLDVPVDLASRQLRPRPFQINLHEIYFVELPLNDSVDDAYEDGRCNVRFLMGSEFRIYRFGSRGQAQQLGSSSAWGYDLPAGLYQVEWDLPSAAACLNGRHPHLTVLTDAQPYQEAIFFFQAGCVLGFATGLILIATAAGRALRIASGTDEPPRIFPGMVLRNVVPIARLSRAAPIHDPPHWPLLWVTVVMVLMIIFMSFAPPTPNGLFVTWKNAFTWERSPWPDTLAVYVRTPGRFFINGREVSRADLYDKLIERLNRRVEWTVYFEADPNVEYADAMYAIDTIQSCGAKLVWITPKTRDEWQHNSTEVQIRRKSEPTVRIVPE